MTALLRTIIIDSDEDSRASLQHILAGTASVIVGKFRNIPEALRTALGYRPDVIVVEIPLEQGRIRATAQSSSIEHLARVLPDAAILVTGPTQSAHLVIRSHAGGCRRLRRTPGEARGPESGARKGRSLPPWPCGAATQRACNIGLLREGRRRRHHSGHESCRLLGPALFRAHDLGRSGYAPVQRRNIPKPPLQYSVYDAFENIGRMDESFIRRLLAEHASGLWVLPGPAPMEHVKLRPEQVQAGIEILRPYFDQIILDLPHDLDATTVAALEASDTIFFLVSQNVSALRLGTAGIGALRHLGMDLQKVRLVLMRERTGEDVTLKQVREMLGVPIHWKMPSDYSTVVTAINNGEPLVTALPRSKIAKNLRQLSGPSPISSRQYHRRSDQPG